MAVTLVGEIVNSCDAVTGFNAGTISGDDDFVEGTGALGVKASNTTQELYTTSLGATAPYNFAVGGAEEGYHIIMWFNTKTPIDTKANGGLAIIVGNGTSRGKWYVRPSGFYKGGFITRVVDTARNFNNIAAGTWTTTGNPAQLSNVTQMGGGFVTITSIMGSFNNVQIDQITIGEGVRADGGTIGTPNTFEVVRAADEDTAFYGWWGSSNGAIIGKGKLYIGPATGSATSVFNDTAFAVIFADEDVATGFYEIATRGAGTDVTWELASIAAANPAVARWSLTIDATTNSFSDTNGVFTGANTLTLSSNSTCTGTTFIDCSSLIQNSATLTDITVLDANTADGTAFLTSNNPALISGSSFTFSDGHAIEITTAGTYTFNGNAFNNYLGTTGTNLVSNSGSTDAAIYNNSGGAVTLNITGGGDTPSVRNGAGATTTVNNNVNVDITVQDIATAPIQNAVVAIYNSTNDTEISNSLTNASGQIVTASVANGTPLYIRVRKSTSGATRYFPIETLATASGNISLTITMTEDSIASA